MNNPLVSICIPAYNSAPFIERTIRSALKQTYDNIEVVVVDDCSSDNTVQVVQSIEDERVRLICNESNLGMTGNWNKCVRSCKENILNLFRLMICYMTKPLQRAWRFWKNMIMLSW